MSAQAQGTPPAINGVSSVSGCDAGAEHVDVRANGDLSTVPEAPLEQTTATGEPASNEPGPSSRLPGSSSGDVTTMPSGSGPESTLRQERLRMASTTYALDGHPSGELLAERRQGAYGNPEFLTPRSAASLPSAQNNWLGGLEVPRWFSRLGSYLSVGHAELVPSPLLGSPSTPSPPPGGQPFRLRSPGRPQRSLPPPPTPPSSSDLPQEAIQAEVQRQLGGLLSRLQVAEDQNQALGMELDETHRTLLLAARQASNTVQVQEQTGTAQGDLRDGAQGWIQSTVQQQVQVPPSVALSQAPTIPPSCNVPLGLGVPAQDPPRDEDGQARARDEGFRGQRLFVTSQPEATTPRFTFGPEGDVSRGAARQTPMAPAPPPVSEPRGFLRSFLGPVRPRGDSPPPPKSAVPNAQEYPMMDALMRGVQQLQELQAAALAKGQSLAAEVVKPGTTVLSPLPSAVHGAESALMFQDWLEVTSAIMRDVSEQSGLWWEAVLQEVEKSYKVWLAATPLERLNVMPGGTELSEGRWMRLNARVASMFLSAMTVEQRGDIAAEPFQMSHFGLNRIKQSYESKR